MSKKRTPPASRPVGRPKAAAAVKRKHILRVRFNEAEWALIKDAAKAKSQEGATWARAILLAAAAPPGPTT